MPVIRIGLLVADDVRFGKIYKKGDAEGGKLRSAILDRLDSKKIIS
ncbi:hypothetical protein LC653_31015 [Nostoc sp. CHAB 5784]|nr:hypothetical protein [Nostoc mirabile]MCC5668174.1 hypothetical protein [Nostoc mirabile CHAB5784]